MAAQLKQFTLEDLNFGGNNYHNMRPKNMYLRWWGDKLMYQDAEEWGTVDMKTGSKTAVATLDKVDAAMGNGKVASAMNVAFPYPDSPLALLKTARNACSTTGRPARWCGGNRARASNTATGQPKRAPWPSSGTTSYA